MRVRQLFILLLAIGAMIAEMPSTAQAWHGHRNYRSYRSGRSNAGVQRAAVNLNMARARLNAAQNNVALKTRQARQQAQNQPNVVAAKSNYTNVSRDYQTAKEAAVARLKEQNTEFKNLLSQCDTLRQKIASLSRAGDTSGQIQTLEAELRPLARKANLIEDHALNSDSKVKDVTSKKADSHATAQSAEQSALNEAANDPNVLAARKELSQAQSQVQQAASKYSAALASANRSGMYRGRGSYRPRYGYVSVGVRRYGGYRHSHHAHHRRR